MYLHKLEFISRYLGIFFLVIIGVFTSLLVVTIAGGAIPSGSYETNPSFMNDSVSSYTISIDSNVQRSLSLAPELPRVYHQNAVIYSVDWRTVPIKVWSLIIGAVTVFIGILYLASRWVHSGMSGEIFP
jgi:hypothetical protein